MSVNRVGDLEISEDLRFQNKQWKAERIGWAVGLLVLALALLGLFGGGPLAHATVADPSNTFTVDHDRIVRKASPTDLVISVPGGQSEVGLWIDLSFLDRIKIESISPEPMEVMAANDRLIYRFTLEESAETAHIRIHLQHQRIGIAEVRLGLVSGPSLAFREIVLP